MRILILGAGTGQVSAIKKAKNMGHEVVVSDYYTNPPGKKFADFHEQVSTFDIEANIKIGRKFNIDGIMTSATDQPVYTAAAAAQALNLPFFLSPSQARAVTNKRNMKKKLIQSQIPTARFKLLGPNFKDEILSNFSFPVVVKPLDSQGQRGVFKLNKIQEVRNHFEEVVSYSREEEILLEEYYPGDEITVSGWVKSGNLHLLTVTDRITYENGAHIGICSAHIFPSRFLDKYYQDIKNISERIVNSFSLKNGPIYFQMLVGEKGIKVNEIACRIGGAYEGDFMPELTGVDILGMRIKLALGKKLQYQPLREYDLQRNETWLSVQLFFAYPGTVSRVTNLEDFTSRPEIMQAGLNYGEGDVIPQIENATARAGYFIVRGDSRKDLKSKISQAYDNLKILNNKGENLIIREIGEVL